MANPWFRLYAEFAHDPKVQMMSEVMQRRYVMIMCMRCSNDLVTLHETEIAFHLRVTETELAETKALFVSKGFIDDEWNLLNWEKRQFKSDSSAERVARHRAKKKTPSNGDVTLQKRRSNALDTDTDTDTDTDNKKTHKKENALAADPANTDRVCPLPVSDHQEPTAPPGRPRDLPTDEPPPVSPRGAIAAYVRSQGMLASPADQEFRDLIAQGATMEHFVDAVPMARERGKSWKYMLGIVKNMMQEAQAPPRANQRKQTSSTHDSWDRINQNLRNQQESDHVIDGEVTVVDDKQSHG